MKSLLFIVVLSLLAVGYARDQEAELAIRGGKKGNSCMKQGGMCIKGKSCPNGYEACGLSCGKGKKNNKKKCCCLIPPTPTPDPTCPEGWVENGNQCYFILPETKEAFVRGLYLCNQLGATLPIIKSAEENAFLLSLMEGKDDPRLGMIAPNGDNVFEWLDGTAVADTFSAWNASEPNNRLGIENCAQLYVRGSAKGKWIDEPCSNSRHIVCQKEKK